MSELADLGWPAAVREWLAETRKHHAAEIRGLSCSGEGCVADAVVDGEPVSFVWAPARPESKKEE